MLRTTPRRSTALLAAGVLALGGLTAACEDDDGTNDDVDLDVDDGVEEDLNDLEQDVEDGVDDMQDTDDDGVDEMDEELDPVTNEGG